jgi:hypothetical protein
MNKLNVILRLLISVYLSIAFLSCANQSPRVMDTQVITTKPLTSGPIKEKADLYIINISGWTLIPGNQEITDNGLVVADLPRETYKRIYISSGLHEFRFAPFPQGRRFAKLDAQDGRTYYLVVGYNPGRSWAFPLAGDPMVIKLVAEEVAKNLMKEMKPEQ